MGRQAFAADSACVSVDESLRDKWRSEKWHALHCLGAAVLDMDGQGHIMRRWSDLFGL